MRVLSLLAVAVTFLAPGFAEAATSVKLKAVEQEAIITLSAPLAQGEALYLVSGPTDAGLQFASWSTPQLVAEGDGVSRQCKFRTPLPTVPTSGVLFLRALVLPRTPLIFLKANTTSTYINLNETPAFDRSYELTLRYDSLPSGSSMSYAYGGLYRINNSVVGGLQLWVNNNTLRFYESPDSATGNADIANLTAKAPIAIRFDLRAGKQQVWARQTGDAEYQSVATLSLTEIPHLADIGLYLFSRKDGNSASATATTAAIANYRVTDLATGAVIKDLVPANVSGVPMMVDAANDNAPYPAAAGSFSFSTESVAATIGSEALQLQPLTITRADGMRVKVAVTQDLTEKGLLVLGWGPQDGGSTTTNGWAHVETYATPIGAEGGEFSFSSTKLGISAGNVTRAFVFPYEQYSALEYANPRDSGSFISVGNSAFDRQYDMRICYSASASAYFGGLDSLKTKIIQLYNNASGKTLQVWLGDDKAYDLITNPTVGQYYDIRFVFRNGSQATYWKRAEDTEYTAGPSASLTSIYTGELYFLARNLSGSLMGSTAHLFQRFTATNLSTGETLLDLYPVDRGGQKFIYNQVTGTSYSVNGSLSYANEQVSEFEVLSSSPSKASELKPVILHQRGTILIFNG